METGRPITVVSGRDNSLSGVNFDRPDVNGSQQLPTDPVSRRIDRPLLSDRGLLRQPSRPVRQCRTRHPELSGRFRLGHLHIEVIPHQRIAQPARWDAFNVINRPNLGGPNSTLVSPAFGRIQSAGGGRVMQVSLKYAF